MQVSGGITASSATEQKFASVQRAIVETLFVASSHIILLLLDVVQGLAALSLPATIAAFLQSPFNHHIAFPVFRNSSKSRLLLQSPLFSHLTWLSLFNHGLDLIEFRSFHIPSFSSARFTFQALLPDPISRE